MKDRDALSRPIKHLMFRLLRVMAEHICPDAMSYGIWLGWEEREPFLQNVWFQVGL